jgi:aminopeptidase N
MVDAVRDAEVPAGELIELAARALPGEGELSVVRDVARFVSMTAVDCYLPLERQPAARRLLSAAYLGALEAAPAGDGRQLLAARCLTRVAGPEELPRLRGWLDGVDVPEGLEVDAELRWELLERLVAFGAGGEAEIAAEYDRDRTAAGAEHAAQLRASIPDAAAKSAAWDLIINDDSLSNRLLFAAATGFWAPWQSELTAPYVSRFFDDLPGMAQRRTMMVLRILSEVAYPRFAVEPETLRRAEAFLAAETNPILLRAVGDGTDDLRRALAARALAGADGHGNGA